MASTASTSSIKTEPLDVKPSVADVKPKVKPAPALDLNEIERMLNQDELMVTRDAEVERVLRCFHLNPYEILDLDFKPGVVTDDEIRKTYRKRSLLIHPDKLKHPRAVEAFDLLKKAATDLEDPEKRKYIDQTIADARMLVMRSLKLPDNTVDSHVKLQGLKPPLRDRIKTQAKEIFLDDEGRKGRVRQMTMIAEGAENARRDKEAAELKRKRDEKQAWEDSRENRVADWRHFSANASRKKVKKTYLG